MHTYCPRFSTGLHSHLECIALAFASKQENTSCFNYLSVPTYFFPYDCLKQIKDKHCLLFSNALELDVTSIDRLGLLDSCPK